MVMVTAPTHRRVRDVWGTRFWGGASSERERDNEWATRQLTGITSSFHDTQHPATLFSLGTYSPFGGLATGTYGDNNGTGTVRTNTYDKRGRLTEIQDGSTPTYRLFLGYYANSAVS